MPDGSTIAELKERYPWLSNATLPIVQTDNATRISWIKEEQHYVSTPQMQQALAGMKFVLTQERRRRMDCIFLSGLSGTGKTTVAVRFLKKMGVETEADGLTVRIVDGKSKVIAIDISGVNDADEFFQTVARACTSPSAMLLNYSRDAVLRMVADIEASVLIIDEADKLASLHKDDQRAIVWAMKYLTNNAQVGIIALGTRDLDGFISSEDTLKHRFRKPINLFALDNISMVRHFVNALATRMPMRKQPDIDNPAFMRKIKSETQGRQPEVSAILRTMALHAIAEGVEQLNMDMLKLSIANPYIFSNDGEDENG